MSLFVIINNAHSCSDVGFWAQHLQNIEENERAELKQIRGLHADTLPEALEAMQRQARINPRTKNFMYHADFNPRRDEQLTKEERDRALEIFETERGIPSDAARIIMEHVKNGRRHWHVIWYRLDHNGRPFPDSLDAQVAHHAGENISKELGLEKVISPFTREPGTPRSERAPKAWEMLRGMKTGIDARDVKAEVTELRQQCANGIEFYAALEKHGYILAHGDKIIAGERALMIIDPAGNDYHLPRYIAGMNGKQVNEFMRDVDRASLPSIQQAKEQQQERRIAALEADRTTVRAEIQWQEALEKAAIAKEEKERQFVEPHERAKADARAEQQPNIMDRIKQELAEVDRLLYGPSIADLKQELAEVDKVIREAAERKTKAGREQTQPGSREEKHWPIHPPQHQSWPGFEKAATEATRDERTQDLKGPAVQVWAAWCEIDKDAALTPAQEEEARRLGVTIHEAREKVIAAKLAGKTVSFSVPPKEVFAASLDDRGISFAAVTKEEAERSHREAEFAKAAGNYAPRFKQGEIVIVTEQRPEYRRDDQTNLPARVHKLDQSLAEKFTKHLGIRSQLRSIDATLKLSDERMQQRRADRETTRLEHATNTKPPIRVPVRAAAVNVTHGIHKTAAVIGKAATLAAPIGKALDLVGGMVEAFAAPKLTPQQIHDGEKAKDRREAEADFTIDFSRATAEAAQQRQQENEREAARQRQRNDGGGRER